MLALSLPTLLALGVASLYNRIETHPTVQDFTRGLSMGVVGLTLAVAWELAGTAIVDWRGLAIAIAALAMALSKRVPVLLILGLGALAGWLLYGL